MSEDKDKIIESLRAELELAYKFHDVAVKERDYERHLNAKLQNRVQDIRQKVVHWLEGLIYTVGKTPEGHLPNDLEAMAIEAKAFANIARGDYCEPCAGHGQRTYASTSGWRGGVGGQSLTVSVCDKCWGTGRKDVHGPNLRELEGQSYLPKPPKPSSSADPMLCSWCGNPKNSTTCQRSHP